METKHYKVLSNVTVNNPSKTNGLEKPERFISKEPCPTVDCTPCGFMAELVENHYASDYTLVLALTTGLSLHSKAQARRRISNAKGYGGKVTTEELSAAVALASEDATETTEMLQAFADGNQDKWVLERRKGIPIDELLLDDDTAKITVEAFRGFFREYKDSHR